MDLSEPQRDSDSGGPFFLGIDLGGTNIKAGVVSGSGRVLSRCSVPTHAHEGPESGVRRMCEAGDQAVEESGVDSAEIIRVGVATPGTMDIPAGMLLAPPNLPGWINIPIREQIAAHFQKPAVLQNDANAAAYGEYWSGAARDAGSLAFWTLGTGVGGGIIIGDTIIEGEHSHGSECGHLILEMDGGRVCAGTGQRGTLEAYSSATALIKQCEQALADGRPTSIRARLEAGETLSPLLMAETADAGDELATELILEAARCLGAATTTVIHIINPAMVLIGGAMTFGRHDTSIGRRFLQRIRDEVAARGFEIPAGETVIDYAALGGDAGFIGAAGCARLEFRRTKSGG